MKDHYIRFGEFIKKKRLEDPRELTMQDIATHLGVSLNYISEVEKSRRPPLIPRKLESLAEFLKLSDEDKARMYDLAGRESQGLPHDIKDTFLYEPAGEFARVALRRSQAGFITEEDWKKFISDKNT